MSTPRISPLLHSPAPVVWRRRQLLAGLGGSLLGWGASAQGTRRIVCPFAPGGVSDRLCRSLALALGQHMGEPWSVVNVPGAGGLLGLQQAVRSEPDGRTLILTPTGVFRSQAAGVGLPQEGQSARLDVLRQLQTLAVLGETPLLFVASANTAVVSLRAHLQALRAQGRPLVFGSTGHASTSHVLGMVLAQRAGLEVVHVPYQGSLPLTQAVLAGHLPLAATDPMTVAPLLASGQLVALGLSSAQPSARLPKVSTLRAQGLLEDPITFWHALATPAGVPQAQRQALEHVLPAVWSAPAVQEVLQEGHAQGALLLGASAQQYVEADCQRFAQYLRALA